MISINRVKNNKVTIYLVLGAILGIIWSIISMAYITLSYLKLSYPINWIELPFDFLKSKECMLLIHILTSSALTIMHLSILTFMIGVGVKFIFGWDERSIVRYLVCSLVVIVLWLVGKYLLNTFYTIPSKFQQDFLINLILNISILITLYTLIMIFTRILMLFMNKEKIKGLILAIVLTCGYLALVRNYTGFRLLNTRVFGNPKDAFFYLTIIFGALLLVIFLYKNSLSLLFANSKLNERLKHIKINLFTIFKYSFSLYTTVFLLIGLSLFLYPQFIEKMRSSTTEDKNIILITIDALRPDHLSCYGYRLPTSPQIDFLAAQSSIFTNAISVSPFTLGSVPYMMTSMFPGQIQIDNKRILGPSIKNITLAELLQKKGYETAAFVGNFFLKKRFGPWQGFYIYDDNFSGKESQRGIPEETAYPLTQKAIDWMRAYHRRKFFLWLHYQDPHGPYPPPAPFNSIFKRSHYIHKGPLTLLKNNSGYGGIPRYQIINNERDPNFYLSQYDGEINYVDYNIDILIKTLKRLRQFNKTAIIITADHGEAMVNEGGYYFCHGLSLREEIIKIPLIIKLPELSQGKVISTQVSSLDITPTILELADIPKPDSMMGESLIALIKEGKYEKEFAFSHKVLTSSIRTNNYKLILNQKKLELYDLTTDPKEMNNLSQKDDKKEIVDKLKEKLNAHIQRIKATSTRYKKTELDDKTRDSLKSLGYLN